MGSQILCFAILVLCVVYPGAALEPSKNQSQCQPQYCGDQIVPYPFGLVNSDGCILDPSYLLTCNDTFNPPMLFFSDIPIFNISVETATAIAYMETTYACYNESGLEDDFKYWSFNITASPFTFSSTLNTFMAIGCDTDAYLYLDKRHFGANCVPTCDNNTSIKDLTLITQEVKPCTDIGCCQTKIPRGLKYINFKLQSPNHHSTVYGSNPCDYAFLTGPNAKLVQNTVLNAISSEVVLDWAVGDTTCEEEQKSICGPTTNCINSNNGLGYRCSCKQGYTGNPYTGCQGTGDIKAAVSSATAYLVQGSYIGYTMLLLLGFVKVWY